MPPRTDINQETNSLLFENGVADPMNKANTRVSDSSGTWKLLVIDDDEMIHRLTDAVLEDFTFHDKKLNIIHGYSGDEACRLMEEHPDTAVILLDVVMETDNAGFEVVQYIRKKLRNHQVRIILRTGQPGNKSETEIVSQYEINDYREKSDLTSGKLHSSLIISLRAFQDMKAIQALAKDGNSIDSLLRETTEQMRSTKEIIKNDFHRVSANTQSTGFDSNTFLEVINKSEFIIYIKDLSACYRLVNRKFEEFFAIQCSNIIGKRDQDFLPAPLAEQIMKSDMRVLSASTRAQQEEIIHFNEIYHRFYVLKFPLYDSSGNFSAICGVAAEILHEVTI